MTVKLTLVYRDFTDRSVPPIAECDVEASITEKQLRVVKCLALRKFTDEEVAALGMMRLIFWRGGERAGRAVTDLRRTKGWMVPALELQQINKENP